MDHFELFYAKNLKSGKEFAQHALVNKDRRSLTDSNTSIKYKNSSAYVLKLNKEEQETETVAQHAKMN